MAFIDNVQQVHSLYKNYQKVNNTIGSARDFAANHNAENLYRLLNNIKNFCSLNPIAKLFFKFYDPNLRILSKVVTAFNNNTTALEKGLEHLNGELERFTNESNTIIRDIRFKRDVYQTGSFSYLAYLQKNRPEKSIYELSADVQIICKQVETMIKNLDEILSIYVTIAANYEQLYREASEKHGVRTSKPDLFEQTFSILALRKIEDAHDMLFLSGNYNRNIDQLIDIRNAWADWLGVAKKTRQFFLN